MGQPTAAAHTDQRCHDVEDCAWTRRHGSTYNSPLPGRFNKRSLPTIHPTVLSNPDDEDVILSHCSNDLEPTNRQPRNILEPGRLQQVEDRCSLPTRDTRGGAYKTFLHLRLIFRSQDFF